MRWIVFLLCFVSQVWAASLQWQASAVDETHRAPDGYSVYIGFSPDTYIFTADVGNNLGWVIPDDFYGDYYFAVASFYLDGGKNFSDEIFFRRDAPQPEPIQYVGATAIRASRLQRSNLMASDNFTDANDTALSDHDANWDFTTGSDNGRIYNNGVSYGEWNEGGYRYTGSNGDTSQIIVKPNAGEKCSPAVRMGSATSGYSAHFSNLSGGNYTYLSLYKNASWQAWESGSWSASADHTIRIVATGSASPVTVDVYVDDVLVIDGWSDSSSPYTTGLSGIYLIGDGSNDYAFGDDWTDGATGGASAVPAFGRPGLMRGMARHMQIENDWLKPIGGH